MEVALSIYFFLSFVDYSSNCPFLVSKRYPRQLGCACMWADQSSRLKIAVPGGTRKLGLAASSALPTSTITVILAAPEAEDMNITRRHAEFFPGAVLQGLHGAFGDAQPLIFSGFMCR